MAHIQRLGNGHLGKQLGNGHLTLNNQDFSDCYKIDGYTDGDLTGCATCNASVLPIWDGTFERPEITPDGMSACAWHPYDGNSWFYGQFSIDGKRMWGGLYTKIVWIQAAGGYWQMWIRCQEGGVGLVEVWSGTLVNPTPNGIYTAGFNPPIATGNIDGQNDNHCIDSGADFETDGVIVGSWVENTTTGGAYGQVTATSATDLTLSANIFPDNDGDGYSVANITSCNASIVTLTVVAC